MWASGHLAGSEGLLGLGPLLHCALPVQLEWPYC